MAEPTIKNGKEQFFPIIYEGNGAGQRVGNFIPFTDQATIANSLIFNDGDSAYLSRTPSGTGNRKTFTFSGWVKRGVFDTSNGNDLFNAGTNPGNNVDQLLFDSSNRIRFYSYGGSYLFQYITNRTFEDTSKWYHIVCAVDTTQSSASDRVKIYVDGDLITSFSTETDPALNGECFHFNNTSTNYIGANVGSQRFYDGYIAEYNFVDGQQLTPASFGITDTSTGRWIPKTVEPFPTTTTDIAVTVVSSGGNKYALDGVTQDTVTLIEGATYKFDQSDSSNSGHPLRFSTTSDGTHGSGSEYTTGVTTVGTPGSSGAYTQITVAVGAPTLYYYCSNHSGMGGTANTQDQYGTNGFRLKFQDSSALGDDTSGNGNDFIATNLASTDQTTDSPTQNHATIDPNTASNSSMTFAEGNLNVEMNNAYPGNVLGTLGASSGKYYWEVTISGTGSSANGYATGVAVAEWSKLNSDPGSTTSPFSSFIDSRSKFFHNGASVSNSTSFTAGDVIGIALNLDDSEISYFKNNTIVGSAQPLVDGQTYFPFFKNSTTVADLRYTPNFGQKSWNYTPPTGFVALQQDNLPETAKGVADLVWIKDRDSAYFHVLYDSSRGPRTFLYPNGNQVEQGENGSAYTNLVDGVQKFLKGGFSIEDQVNLNNSGDSFISWNWVANSGTTATNTNGSISSTVQANTTAGFSIVQYTGNGGNAAATIGHGLSSTPEWILLKFLDVTGNWTVYHKSVGNTARLSLNLNAQADTSSSYFNNTSPTSSVFTVGSSFNQSSVYNYVAYCWHPVDGFSKFGSYVGNSSDDGVFVYLGFRPSFLMLKRYAGGDADWMMADSKRWSFNRGSGTSSSTNIIVTNSSGAEVTNYANIDFLSNGFKLRSSVSGNLSSGTYAYMAFAEHPFVGDGTSPVTAR